ncbi:uncharacterized protein LOC136076092 [Hydra vulgaris]|uniref:Uncharacterized protein LOC136076092 n=1 Tax=Hydra vulgaris TaxID=6087 RepID=A0ABM4B9Q3_HYDVU
MDTFENGDSLPSEDISLSNEQLVSSSFSLIKIKKCDHFDSFVDFESKLQEYCEENSHPIHYRSSQKLKLDDSKAEKFIYNDLLFTCVHYGKPRPSKVTTCRPHQTKLAIDCSMKIRLQLKCYESKIDSFALEVTQLEEAHNHPTSKELFCCYPRNRKITAQEEKLIINLTNANVTPLQIKQILHLDGHTKCVTSQDLHNFKARNKKVELSNNNEGQLLVDAVNKLLEKDNGGSVSILQNNDGLQAIYWQTSVMKEKYKRYGEVVFVDSTYKVNIKRFPLLIFLVENGLGFGVLVLFAFVQHETIAKSRKIEKKLVGVKKKSESR